MLFTFLRKQEKRSSEPLAPEQFLSAFFLLLCGVCLAAGAAYSTAFYNITVHLFCLKFTQEN